jgi:hypothetical protein
LPQDFPGPGPAESAGAAAGKTAGFPAAYPWPKLEICPPPPRTLHQGGVGSARKSIVRPETQATVARKNPHFR